MTAVTVTWHNPNPDTILNRLAARLGREPTETEARDEVKRILFDTARPVTGPRPTRLSPPVAS